MSYKAAPAGPDPAGRLMIVDSNATALGADGSWRNPYATIQAALDARPPTFDVLSGVLTWHVQIIGGIYDEHLVIPGSGIIMLSAIGKVFIGDPSAAPKAITYSAVPGFPGPPAEESMLVFNGAPGSFDITANLTITAPSGHTVGVLLDGVTLGGDISATGVADATALTADFNATDVMGLVNLPTGSMNAVDSSFSSAVTTQTARDLERTRFGSTFTQSGPGPISDIRDVSFGGLATFDGLGVMTNCTFDAGFTDSTLGGSQIFNARSIGPVTIDAPLVIQSSSFTTGPLVVNAVPLTGFLGCVIGGGAPVNFTGPVGSFKVDAATNSASNVTLGGGATRDILATFAAPGATGVAAASGEGTADSFARSDHTHQSNTMPSNVGASEAIGASGEPARADHTHLLKDDVVDGGMCKPLVSGSTSGAPPVVFIQTVVVQTGASPVNTDLVVDDNIRVYQVRVILNGAGTAGATYSIANTANLITEAIDVSAGVAGDVFDATSISGANDDITAGGALRVIQSATGNDCPGARVLVSAIRVP